MSPQSDAQEGLRLLKQAIVELLAAYPDGLTNSQVADHLAIRSDYLGGNKDYLSWSVLGLLLNEGKIERLGRRYKTVRTA